MMESENVQSETNDQVLLVEATAETQSTQTTNNTERETQVVKKLTIKLTAKALMEKLITLQKVRTSKLNKAGNLQKVMHELMKERGCETENIQKYLYLCKEAREAHKSLLPVLPPEEKETHRIWFQAKKLSIDKFIDDMEKWMKNADGSEPVENVEEEEEDVENEINSHDRISNVGSKKSTRKSHTKSSSSTSSRSSTSSARLQAEAERAALAVLAAALRERHVLEEQEEMLRKKKRNAGA